MNFISSNSLYILATIGLTAYGQIILKWRLRQWGGFPETLIGKITFFSKVLLDPFVVSGFLSAFGASLCWILVLKRCPLNQLYPIIALNFPLTLWLSYLFLKESLPPNTLFGTFLIVLGIFIATRSPL